MDGKAIKKRLGASLRAIRTSKGLTQEQLAELIGKQPSTITRIESGINFVNCDTLAKICDALEIAPSLLLVKNPHLRLEERNAAIKEITHLLQVCPQNKIEDVYNILNAMIK